jgi:hypothetical protein
MMKGYSSIAEEGGRVQGKWQREGGVVKFKLVEICLSPKSYVCVITTYSLAKVLAPTSFNPTSLILITMVKAPVTQCQIETRASNKEIHPGQAVLAKKCRTTAEVQKEHESKVEAKAAREEAKQQSIRHAAEFEQDDIANKALANATLRPPFTPKPWPPPRNQNTNKVPAKESSDVEITDDFD